MDWHLWSGFLLASIVLMLIPGPNVALIVANSLTYGIRSGFLTVAGTSSACVIQLGLTTFGLSLALSHFGAWIAEVRWLGVAYLVVLGVRQWRARPVDLSETHTLPPRRRGLLLRTLALSLANPKTLLFFGAFFPQFIAADRPAGPQLAVLALTFLGVALTVDSGWALLANSARRVLTKYGALRNKLTGGLLLGAGASLALARLS